MKRTLATALLVTALLGGGASAASTQQQLQIAIQLGAIQMGYTSTNTPYKPYVAGVNLQQDQYALAQGLLMLSATAAKTPSYVRGAGNVPQCQTPQFQQEIYVATLNALSGVNSNFSIAATTVPLQSGANYSLPASKLSTAATTATAVVQLASTLIPNRAAGFAFSAVSASQAGITNTSGFFIPTWGPAPKTSGSSVTVNSATAKAQINNAATAASACLTASCSQYAKGTINWQGFPTNNFSATNLPNFGLKPLVTSGQTQANDPQGLAEAASSVAAGAIAGLGQIGSNTNYGQSASNVIVMVQSLTTAANKVFPTSTNSSTLGVGFSGGTLQAAALAETAQLAGTNNFFFGSYAAANNSNAIGMLTGIVQGSINALGKTQNNLQWVAKGIAEGFFIDYVETSGLGSKSFSTLSSDTNSFASFQSANLSYINNAFTHYGIKATSALDTAIQKAITSGFSSAYADWTLGNKATNNPSFKADGSGGSFLLPGAVGIGINGVAINGATPKVTTPFLNGVGSPVTDTIGL
jgi:hypothetical protein